VVPDVIDFRQPVLIGYDIGQAGLRHMRGIRQHDHLFERRHQRRDLLDDRHEGDVDEEEAVSRVIHDPGDLLREKPRVQRVIDRAAAHDAIPGFQMPPGVPGKRPDTVADLDPVLFQALCQLQRAATDRCIIRAVDRAFYRPRNDFALAMKQASMVDNLVAKQRPILHQTEHIHSSQSGSGG
jgi:hypothetical protein